MEDNEKLRLISAFGRALIEEPEFEANGGLPAGYIGLLLAFTGLTLDDISLFFGTLLDYKDGWIIPGPSWNSIKEKYLKAIKQSESLN